MLDPKNCKRGQEQYEYFHSFLTQGQKVQYDYRALDGELFTTVVTDLESAHAKRDAWLKTKTIGE